MATIGFVGLGAMGAPIAINLLRARNQLAVYDLNASACERLAHARRGSLSVVKFNIIYIMRTKGSGKGLNLRVCAALFSGLAP